MRGWRWSVVAAGTALLTALPLAAHLLPAGDSRLSAGELLHRLQASASVGYSGFAQSTGGLVLPVDSGPFSINDLLGGTTQLRVWWRASDDWRIDTVAAAGETDLHHDSTGTWQWNYESGAVERVTQGPATIVRLPRSDDLVPASLARRLLAEADPADVHRLPTERIAGESAAGLRLVVRDRLSTIRHVDVWALPATGLPVRVAVYGAGPTPVVSASMLDVVVDRPSHTTTAFVPPPGTQPQYGDVGDVVAALDRFGSSTPPATLVGLARRRDLDLGAVGVYGRGVTVLVAIPLPPQLGYSVDSQLEHVPGVTRDPAGVAIGSGPLNLRLAASTEFGGFGGRWLLAGTVSAAALRAAVRSLPPVTGFRFGQ